MLISVEYMFTSSIDQFMMNTDWQANNHQWLMLNDLEPPNQVMYYVDILMPKGNPNPPSVPRVMKKATSASGRSPWMIIVIALVIGFSVFYFMNRSPSEESNSEISKTVSGITVKVF